MRRKRYESIKVDSASPSRMDLDKINNDIRVPKEFNEEYCDSFQNTVVTFLDYAERDEILSDEEIKKEKELFRWYKHGLKAGHLRGGTLNKLTSADVLYILTNTYSSEILAKKFNVDKHTIKNIRRGIQPGFEFEYLLFRRLMTIIRSRGLNRPRSRDRYIYLLYKLDRKTLEKSVIAASLGRTTIYKIRERMVQSREFERFTKSGNLDVYYPIEPVIISS